MSTVRLVCLTFTPQIKKKHQELEKLPSSDRAVSAFEDSSVNETTVVRALLGVEGWGGSLVFYLMELFISWAGRMPQALKCECQQLMPESLIPLHTRHPMRQQKELKPAALSGRKFPNALWYCFSFSVVWSGWMLLVRSKEVDINIWPGVSFNLQGWYLKFIFAF